jgi:hypothetical protein
MIMTAVYGPDSIYNHHFISALPPSEEDTVSILSFKTMTITMMMENQLIKNKSSR